MCCGVVCVHVLIFSYQYLQGGPKVVTQTSGPICYCGHLISVIEFILHEIFFFRLPFEDGEIYHNNAKIDSFLFIFVHFYTFSDTPDQLLFLVHSS